MTRPSTRPVVILVIVLLVGWSVYWVWFKPPSVKEGELDDSASPLDRACGPGPKRSLWSGHRQLYPGSRTYFPDLPEYASPGPHPIQVFNKPWAIYDGDTEQWFGPNYESAVPKAWTREEPDEVQLVVCLAQVAEGDTVDSCTDPEGVAVVEATYDVRVYETHTGREVAAETLTGVTPDCPNPVVYDPDDEPRVWGSLSKEQYVELLRPLVEADLD